MEKELKSLPSDTVRLIGSSQVITSVFSVVKELVENALDSNASSIDVKLENYGLDKVEVRDNGHGIKESNMENVARRYHTSKISSFNDLESLSTYGFRGEALGSLCAVSSLAITSKTCEEPVSFTYSFDHHGSVTARQPSHLGQGTTVAASQLFKNLPVRRQYYNTIKKKKEELKKIEDLLMAYGAIKPGVRFLLKHGKETVWQKNVLPDTRSALLGIMGRGVLTQMEYKEMTLEDLKIDVEYFLPSPKSDVNQTSRSTNDRCFIAVNGRPVQVKEIEKLIKQYYCSCMGVEGRVPMYFISLNISTTNLDVNIDPNKTRVMLHDQKSILSELSKVLEALYGPLKDKKQVELDLTNTSLNDSQSQSSNASLNDSDSFLMDSESSGVNKGSNFSSKGHVIKWRSDSKSGSSSEAVNCDESDIGVSVREHIVLSDNVDSVKKFSIQEHTIPLCNQTSVNLQTNHEKQNINAISNSNSGQSIHSNASVEIGKEQGLVLSNKKEEISVSTQKEQINFSFLDPDLEDLLKTQNYDSDPVTKACGNVLGDIPAELFSSFDEGSLNLDSNTKEKVENNMNDPSSNKENDMTILSEFSATINDALLMDSVERSAILANEDVNKIDSNNTSSVQRSVKFGNNLNSDNSNSGKPIGGLNEAMNWSTGKGAFGSDGKILQPVTLLAPNSTSNSNKRALSDSDLELTAFTPPTKRKSLNVDINQPRLYDVVGKSPREKYSLGFTAFSREERPKVIDENPSLTYDDISRLVCDRWNRLSDMDKKQYEDQGKVQVEHLKKKVQEKQRTTPKLSKKIIQPSTIKEKMLWTTKPTTNLPPIETVKVRFSLQRLTGLYHRGLGPSQIPHNSKMNLVGPLKFYNGWICCHGNKIKVINPHRVEETILLRELMENHVISSMKLENPIRLTESILGQSLIQVLSQVIPTDSCQTYIYIDDKRITSNGFKIPIQMIPLENCQTYIYIDDKRITSNRFKIRCHVDENNHPVLELDSMCKSIPTYGVSDLKEVLQLIKDTSATCLKQCRPLKVIYYLQGEAVRMIRQRPSTRNKEDMLDILEQMSTSLPQDCINCLHDKPFLHTIYDMNDIPASQITQA